MRTKERHLFSKVIAVICVLTLCVTMLTPATYAAVQVNKIVIQLCEGITYYDSDQMSMQDIDSSDTDDYQYRKIDNNSIEVFPLDGSTSLTNKVIFYVDAEAEPEMQANNGAVSVVEYVSGIRWKVTVNTKRATDSAITLSAKKPVKQYTVTFPDDTVDFSITPPDQPLHEEGSDVTFTIKLNSQNPEGKILRVTANRRPLTATPVEGQRGVYKCTIPKLTMDTSIVVVVDDQIFTVTEPSNADTNGYTYTRVSSSNSVKYGESFSFYVTPKEGWNTPTVSVQNTGDANTKRRLDSVGNNQYICSGITANTEIIVEQTGSRKSYTVHFDEGAGYTISNITGVNAGTVSHGDPVSFKVNANPGYKVTRVTANNTVIPVDNGSCTLNNVTADTIISVAFEKQEYTVEYTYDENLNKTYSVTEGLKKATFGDSYTFYVTAKDGYGAPIVKVNEEPVTSIDGKQYVTRIPAQDITINITTGTPNQQTVAFNTGDGYEFTDIKVNDTSYTLAGFPTVKYGDQIQFKVGLTKGYEGSKPVVTVNGVNLQSDEDDIYTIDVTENKVISVSGVQKAIYTVTLAQGDGYKLSTTENTRVTAGDTFTFSLDINAGWKWDEVSSKIKVTVGETEVEPTYASGYYSFKVDGPAEVKVENLKPETYTVYCNQFEGEIKGTLTGISYNGSCEFSVEAAEYYQIDQVAINGVIATAINGKYTINNIVDNNNKITVVTSPIKLTVHYVDTKYNTPIEDGTYTIKNINDKLAEMPVVEGRLYEFSYWTDESGDKVTNINKTDLKEGAITLTAVWELSEHAIKQPVDLRTEGTWLTTGNQEQLRFKTFITLVEDLSEEYRTDVKITGCGTLYSNHDITVTEAIDTKLKSRTYVPFDPDAPLNRILNIDQNVHAYYSDIRLDISDLEDNKGTFKLLLNVKKQDTRYGLGWLELTVGDKQIIVYCEPTAVLVPTTTTTTSN